MDVNTKGLSGAGSSFGFARGSDSDFAAVALCSLKQMLVFSD